MKPDAVCVCHRLVRHVCRTVIETRCSRNRAGAGVARTALNVPSERSVVASYRQDRASGHSESSAFHVKPAYELPASRAEEGVDGSFVRGTACFERKALPPSLMCFKCNVRQTMLPTGSQVWTSLPIPKH